MEENTLHHGGTIELNDYSIRMSGFGLVSQDGKQLPDVISQVILTGRNTSGHTMNRVEIRFRHPDTITGAASTSGDTFIVSWTKDDFEIFNAMLNQSLANSQKKTLRMQYDSIVNATNSYTVSFYYL